MKKIKMIKYSDSHTCFLKVQMNNLWPRALHLVLEVQQGSLVGEGLFGGEEIPSAWNPDTAKPSQDHPALKITCYKFKKI